MLVALAIVGWLLFDNNRAARQASKLDIAVGDLAFQSIAHIYDMRFGVVRIVSSVNELIVLSAVRNKSSERNERASEREMLLVEEGRAIFARAFEGFKKNYQLIVYTGRNIYQPLIAEIEPNYAALNETATAIERLASKPFDPDKFAELKEEFEDREQKVLETINRTVGVGQAESRRLIAKEEAVIDKMKNQTLALGVGFLRVFLVYTLVFFRILFFEEYPRLKGE